MRSPVIHGKSVFGLVLIILLILILQGRATAQTTFVVNNEATLRAAISSALPGDTISFAANVTLTSELPSLGTNLTIDGNGHTLSGADQFRGLTIVSFTAAAAPVLQPVSVAVQNLTIANTVATGGTGGSGTSGGGGGGAGLGGAIYVADLATVSLSNVSIVSSGAVGGSGGAGTGAAGGGGGGIGGNGGTGGGGGGGFGLGATGGSGGLGGDGILSGAGSGGFAATAGGVNGGGGGSGFGGGGGGASGSAAISGSGGAGGYGGGGGGGSAGTGASGGFGGGGGGGDFSSGAGGFGGGGAGGVAAGAAGGFGGGAGADSVGGGGGGGGAALGGAIFVQAGGTIAINGGVTVNGSSVTGGTGGSGAGNGAADGAGIYLGGSGTLTFATGAGLTSTFSDVIVDGQGVGGAGLWSLVKDGAGTLVLSGTNLYSDRTYVIGGTLSVTSNSNLGTGGSLSLNNGTTLAITGSSAFNRQLFLDGTPTINMASGQSATWAGAILDVAAPATLRVSGGGTLSLTGANGYSGGTIVTGGTALVVSSDAALGSSLGTLTLGDAFSSGTLGIATGTTMVSARNVIFGGAPGGTFDVQGTSLLTLTGTISGPGPLAKTGTGTLTLFGANTYTGGTLVSAGLLQAGSVSAFGGGSSMTVAGGATLDLNGFSQSFGALSGGGNIMLGSATLTTGGGGSSTLSGIISGAGSLVKTGPGTLTLSGANTYTGGTNVSAGFLQAGSANAFGSGGSMTVAGGATLDLNGFSQSFGTLSGGGNIMLGSATLTTGGSGINALLSGVISGSGSLVKAGTGTLTLSGANTYTGGTLASAGLLQAGSANAFGGGSMTVAGGATLDLNGFSQSFGALSGGGNIMLDSATLTTGGNNSSSLLSGIISGSGSLVKAGAGTLMLSGVNTYAGGTLVAGGLLRAGSGSAFGSGSMTVAGGATLDLNGFSHSFGTLSGGGNIMLGSATLTTGGNNSSSLLPGVISGSGSLVKEGTGTLVLTGANSYTGGTVVLAGALVGNTTSLGGNITNNAVVVFDQATDGTYAGSMSGSGVLQKAGSGTLTLTGTNTNTGGILVSGGLLTGRASSFRGTIANFGSLAFGGDEDDTFAGILSGSGALTKTGAGTLTITGAQSFGGLTTVSQGTLALNGVLGGSVNVAPGATFRASGLVGGSVDVRGSLFVPAPFPITVPPPITSQASFNAARSGDLLTTPPVLTIGGNLTAWPGSVLSIPIAPGPYPSTLVGGTAELNGTHLDLLAADLGSERVVSFLALAALRGLTITDTSAATQSPLIVPTLLQDGTSLYVTLLNLAAPLSLAVTNPNYASVAGAIDRLKNDLSGDRGVVIRELLALDDKALNDALRLIAGEVYASSLHLAIRSSEAFTDMIRDSITERDHETEEGQYGWGSQSVRWWGQVSREHDSFAARDGAFGGGFDITDGAGGFDWRLSERWLMGAGGGFGGGRMGLDGVSASTDFAAPRAFGFVGFKPKAFGLRAGGSLARSKSESKRRIFYLATLPLALGGLPLTNGIDREAFGEEISVLNDEWGEFADNLDVKSYRFDYMFGYRHARFARRGFLESGAGALALELLSQTLNLSQADVKLHLWRQKGGVRPYIETMFRRELTDGKTTTAMRLAGEQEGEFEVEGWPVGGNTFAGRAGVTFVGRIGKLTLEYTLRKSAGQTGQSGDLRVRF